jgi:hypothetical protein
MVVEIEILFLWHRHYIIALFFLLSKLFFLIGKRLPIINFINKEKFTRCIYIGQGQEKTEAEAEAGF